MDLLAQTKKICQQYNIKPARSKGQNFLISGDVYDKIIANADLEKDDLVLEVGPGLGFLTERLAKTVNKVIAVEVDNNLAEWLRKRLKELAVENVKVVNEDILTSPLTPLLIRRGEQRGRGFKIVANLPYNITSIFLRKFLTADYKPETMVLLLQKEVAQRIAARPPKMSLLAVSVQFYAEPEIIGYVDKENFWPQPEVDSAIIKLIIKNSKLKISEKVLAKDFFRLVKFGFSARRKMLKNNLAAGYRLENKAVEEKLEHAGFSPKIRAQDLSINDWQKIFEKFS